MAAATLRLQIVTPEHQAYSDDVEMVVIPAIEGEMGVLPMHVPLMTQITPGELVVTQHGKQVHLAVGEGFVEIRGERVSVLTDVALEASAIDESAAEAAIARAQAAMKEDHSGEDVAALQAMMQKALAQLNVKRRRRS